MPEAVEVRKFADILETNILGQTITHINILNGRYTKKPFEGYNELIKSLPLQIKAINTKGKFTYMTLVNEKKNTSFYLFNTLGLSGGWTLKSNKKTNFAKCIHCNYMDQEQTHNIFPRFTLKGDQVDLSKTLRQKNGIHNLLYTGLFQNACICFKTFGLTLRDPGSFIAIDKTGGCHDNNFNNKLYGQWFVVKIDHTFEAGSYMNAIYAVKIHRHKHPQTAFQTTI